MGQSKNTDFFPPGSGSADRGAGRPKISVIVPVYNLEDYLHEAIGSVLAQSYPDFELIAIDDGSGDRSREILKDLADGDKRIRVLEQSNQGPAEARNRALDVATGEYIYCFDGDDLLEPDTFEVCVSHIDEMQLDLVAFAGVPFSSDGVSTSGFDRYRKPPIPGPISGQELFASLDKSSSYSCSPSLYIFARELRTNPPLRFDEGYIHEDNAFTAEIYCRAKRAASLPNTFFHRRVRRGSIMTSRAAMTNVAGYAQAAFRLGKNLEDATRLEPLTIRILRRRQKELTRKARALALETGNLPGFIEAVNSRISPLELLRYDPLMLLFTRAQSVYRLLNAVLPGSLKYDYAPPNGSQKQK